MIGTILRKLPALLIPVLLTLIVALLPGRAASKDDETDIRAGTASVDIDYPGMANNLMSGLIGESPEVLDKYITLRERYEIGKAIWQGKYAKAVDMTLQQVKDKAIGKVPVLGQLYAMGQLGQQLGDLAWMTYGPGEFDKIYNKYFKDFSKDDLNRPPDDFVKAMIREGSATVLFGWLDRQTGETLTSDRKVALVWDMIRKRRSFEMLCDKHHLQKDACTYDKLMKLERNEAIAIAEVAKEVAQDSQTSDDLAKALYDGRKAFDRSYVSGLSWSIGLQEVLPFQTMQGAGDRAFWGAKANIRRYGKTHKSLSRMAHYFTAVTIRIENNSGHDLKDFYLSLAAGLEKNDCILEQSGTVTGIAFTNAVDPSRPAGGVAPGDVYDRLYSPIDDADIKAQKDGLPNWFRNAISEKKDLRRGESRTFTVILGASNREKLDYSNLKGYFYGGQDNRQLYGVFLRRPLSEPRQAPKWRLETISCAQPKEQVAPFDNLCTAFSPSPGIALTETEITAIKNVCAQHRKGLVSLGASHLQAACRSDGTPHWQIRGLPRRLFGNRRVASPHCSSINELISWKIDVGKSKTSTETMFRIHVTNNSGKDLPRFRLGVSCARDYLNDHAIYKRMFEYLRHGPVLSGECKDIVSHAKLDAPEARKCNSDAQERWQKQNPPSDISDDHCHIQKLQYSCDNSPWRSGLKTGETKTYKVVYNGCGGIFGKLDFDGVVLGRGLLLADGSPPPAYMFESPDYLGDIGYFLRFRAQNAAPRVWKRQPSPQAAPKQ